MTDREREDRIHWLKHEIFRLLDLGQDAFELKQELLKLEVERDNK